MKINEVIREKRLAKGLTQEQVASCLGVSASAVNKWEKAASYPDITLLPPLARLLETDLNTLLSFQEDLTREEIADFLNSLYAVTASEGLDCALSAAWDKLRAFPNSDSLLLNTALTLEGMVLLYGDKEQAQREVKSIEALYVRAAESRDPAIANQAKAMLFSKYMERRELDRAEKVLDELPDQPQFDKKQMQSAWYMAQDKWEDAARLTEHRVLTDASGLQSALLTLAEIAVKESRMEDAETLTQTAGKLAELFHLGEYSAWVPAFQLALLRQDADRCLDALEHMLPALESGWTIENSPLYRHLPPKNPRDFPAV